MFAVVANFLAIISLSFNLANFVIGVNQRPNGRLEFLVEEIKGPVLNNLRALGVEVSARSVLVTDLGSGAVLWQKNAQTVRPLASITKLVTALVVLDHQPDWQKLVTVSKSDYRSGGRRYIFFGQKLSLEDLFKLSLITSSNEATVALARSVDLSEAEFVSQMNQKALSLGMIKTFFVEPTGLSNANVSTAEDITKLLKAVRQQEKILEVTKQSEAVVRIILPTGSRQLRLPSTDDLLGSQLNIIGAKTGYLEEAGYCLASLIKGPDGQELAIVILGSQTNLERVNDVKALVWWIFKNYSWS